MEMNDIEKDISNEYCLHGNLLFLLFLTIKWKSNKSRSGTKTQLKMTLNFIRINAPR